MSEKLFSATSWAGVTASDTAVLRPYPVALFVGGAGDVAVKGADGVLATFTVPAGVTLSIQPRQVLSTGTTATNIIALFN